MPINAGVVVYLLHFQLLPEQRLAAVMADLFGVHPVTATIASMSHNCAARLAGFASVLRDRVAAAAVKHLDGTGFRVGGKTQWLPIASTIGLTFYRISPRRGSLPENLTGIVVHDHWKPYYTLTGVRHALCNAHHLRELQALIEIEREDWARRMQTPLRRACHAANLARRQGQPLPPRLIGHNLLLRLSTRKPDVRHFLSNPDVPFTNNLAERDGRMMKLRQKISGGFRALTGAADFAVIRSMLSTAKKQQWHPLHALNANPNSLIQQLKTT